MKRQLALIDFALGGLRRRLGKSLALTVGLAFVIALFGAALLLTDALRAEYARGTGGMPDLTVQRLVAGRPALIDVSVSEEIAALPAVRRVTPRVWGYYFFVALEANVTVVGATEAHVLEDGRLPTEDGEVTVGASIADLLGLRVGDEIGIPVQGEVQFSEVVGVFGEDAAIRTADLIVATPTHARRLLGMPEGSATDLAIDLTTQDEASVLTERIGALVPGARVLDARLLERTYELTFDTRGGLLALLFLPALAAFLLLRRENGIGKGRLPAAQPHLGVDRHTARSDLDGLAVQRPHLDLLATKADDEGLEAGAREALGDRMAQLRQDSGELPRPRPFGVDPLEFLMLAFGHRHLSAAEDSAVLPRPSHLLTD